ncbi:MAG: hypothetical protein JO131_03990, partial [Gammaproteobacteria bacterium]|nr:hypothetical protein [Gammaproteobacteria bacterium]
MLKYLLNIKVLILILFFISNVVFAEEVIQKNDYLNKTQAVTKNNYSEVTQKNNALETEVTQKNNYLDKTESKPKNNYLNKTESLQKNDYLDKTEIIQKNNFYLDKTEVVLQQIDLLKNRILQAKHEYNDLLRKQDNQATNFSADHVNKQWLNWLKLDVSAAQSNLDSIGIELSEAQQITLSLEKDTNELSNEINALNIFGSKISKNGAPNLASLRAQLTFQKNLLHLEKQRLESLDDLQAIADKILQVYNANYSYVENVLKSQTMLQLKERQAKNEIDFQQQQDNWLQHLNSLTIQLNHVSQSSNPKDKITYIK